MQLDDIGLRKGRSSSATTGKEKGSLSRQSLRRTTIRARSCYYFQNIKTKKSELEIVDYKKRRKEEQRKRRREEKRRTAATMPLFGPRYTDEAACAAKDDDDEGSEEGVKDG